MGSFEPEQFATIGRRIRERRIQFGLSTREVAERAGVSRNTIVRLEAGFPTTSESLYRIRMSLHLFSDQVVRPYTDEPFSIHRAEESQWNISIPKEEYQRRIEEDDPIHINDPAERRRLGTLGFQPFFTAIMTSELANGVAGHAMMELYRPTWVDSHYGEEFVYCLQGDVVMTVDNFSCTLKTGDAMSFDAMLPHQYGPASPVGPDDPVPKILLVLSRRPDERVPRPTGTF